MKRSSWLVVVAIGIAWQGVCQSAPSSPLSVFEMPRIMPQHNQLRMRLIQAMRSGQTAEMEAIAREGIALMPLDATWQYNLACALAYRAEKKEALGALDRAIELGFRDAKQIAEDKDLASLVSLPEFQALLKKAASLAGKPVPNQIQVRPSTVVMGYPAQVNASNTIWDLDLGCFRTSFQLLAPENKPVRAFAESYEGAAKGMVQKWMREGSAAGNHGDLYVNRDGGHSLLDVTLFPKITPVVYSADAQQHRVHMGAANSFFDQAVLGNASLAMTTGPLWRSLPRASMGELLPAQIYLNNQVWFYPSHRDFTREAGDLYPANSPYWIISQGSSGSERFFMNIFASALAAMNPEAKRVLRERGILAPTLQMLFRSSLRGIRTSEDYLSGKAHPVVFDPMQINADTFIEKAHDVVPEQLMPLIVLRPVKENRAEVGVDYFDLQPEILWNTPFAIARIVRAVRSKTFRICVAAQPVGALPSGAQIVWRVLQGDESKIAIRPLDGNGQQVEISVDYHGSYRPTQNDIALLQSSRVDIGCFIQSGDRISAPSFISIFYLQNESRVYREDGQILSVDYSNVQHRYVDPLLTLTKDWKDLYEYDPQGRCTGWNRVRATDKSSIRFTPDGARVTAVDASGRPTKAVNVQYLPRQVGRSDLPPSLTFGDTTTVVTYRYTNALDRVGTRIP